MSDFVEFPTDSLWLARHTRLMLDSFAGLLNRELMPREGSSLDQARAAFQAPFVLLSHGTQADPILNYGNRTALKLWETDWTTLTQTPSRLTAEPVELVERARMFERVARDGYIADYRGIRISTSGRRFQIDQAWVWNLLDEEGQPYGQAACFSHWKFIRE